MKSSTLLRIVGSAVSILAIVGGAFAADAGGCHGEYLTTVDVLQVAPNHMVMTFSQFGTGYVTNDPTSPLKGAAGPCIVFTEVIDGKPSGQGQCVRTDSQGDKFLVSGTPEVLDNTGVRGKWKLVGLTGKWIGASGSGEFWDAGSGKDNKHTFQCFSGSLEMKK
jgi:hypothetical protein